MRYIPTMPAPITIALQRLPHGAGLPLPAYATAGAAGMDVVAAEDVARDCRKKPIWVLGGAEATYTDSYRTIGSPWGRSIR